MLNKKSKLFLSNKLYKMILSSSGRIELNCGKANWISRYCSAFKMKCFDNKLMHCGCVQHRNNKIPIMISVEQEIKKSSARYSERAKIYPNKLAKRLMDEDPEWRRLEQLKSNHQISQPRSTRDYFCILVLVIVHL